MQIILVLSFVSACFGQIQWVPGRYDPCKGVSCPSSYECVRGACRFVSQTAPSSVCGNNPCLRDCQCVPSCKHADGYYCHSPSGYMGRHCNIAAPVVNCTANQITISVAAEVLEEVYAESEACVYVGGSVGKENEDYCKVCSPTDGNYVFSLLLPFDKCGTLSNVTSAGAVSISNLLWAGYKNNREFDMPVSLMQFECLYDREYEVVTSIRPTVDLNRPSLNNSSQAQGVIDLCKIGDACPNACPPLYSVQGGAIYTISETIHVAMTIFSALLTTESDYSVMLERMYLSCSIRAYRDMTVLINEGCELLKLSTRINRRSRNTICVSFKVPRLLKCKNSPFYIHAHLKLVENRDQPICQNRFYSPQEVDRSKRSIEIDEKSVTAVSGPIFIVSGDEGVPTSFLFPDNTDHSPQKPLQGKSTESTESNIGVVVFGVICIVAFAIPIVAIALYLRSVNNSD